MGRPGREGAAPDGDDAAKEGSWPDVAPEVDQWAMRWKRGEARLAIDVSRFVILRAQNYRGQGGLNVNDKKIVETRMHKKEVTGETWSQCSSSTKGLFWVRKQSRKVIGRQGLVAGHAHDVRLGWAIERYWRAEDPNFLCLGPGPSLGGVPGKKRLMVWGFCRAKISPVASLHQRSMSSASMLTPQVLKMYWLMPDNNSPTHVVWSWLGLRRRD